MSAEENMKIVDFNLYCPTCVHNNDGEETDPCHECLYIPARQYSHMPEYYEEDENAKDNRARSLGIKREN